MSTIWIDSRTGSKELLPLLRKQGLTAELATLDAGDFAFDGAGPDGPGTLSVGIERKTLSDLVGSLRSGRLQGRRVDGVNASQIHRLHETYEVVFLLVEGRYYTDRRGRLLAEQGRRALTGGFSEDSLNKALLSLQLRGGMQLQHTRDAKESARWLATLFRWFTDKGWDAHSTLHTPMTRESITPVSQFRDIVMRFAGLGIAASLAVERFCTEPDGHPSLETMLRMPLSAWENLEVATPAGPRKLGTAKAGRILEAVRKLR